MLHTTMFLGYVSNRLGPYFNLLVWIGALGSGGVFVTFIMVVYSGMFYMSVLETEVTNASEQLFA